MWEGLFAPEVNGVPVRDFIISTVVSRPRDIIYLVSAAAADAVNSGHKVVEEGNWYSARRKYSEHVFRSIMVEDDARRQKLESVLYTFSHADKVLTRSEVEGRIRSAVGDENEVEYYLGLLCDVNFLGMEANGGFSFARDEGHRDILLKVARKGAQLEEREEQYLINAAFYDVLLIR